MANVLIGATGSVASVRVPVLHDALVAEGHAVKVVATDAALYFFEVASIPTGALVRDADEWPGERYRRDDPVLHVELRKWADIFALAPLDANTLAKIAVGLCDNCLTCVWRAWDTAKPVVLAPAMNAFMWEHPFTKRHLRSIGADCGAGHVPGHLDDAALIAQINDRSKTLRIVSPVEKRLACGDIGIGGLAEVADIVQAVRDMLVRFAA
ncbi:MAG TPA: flavoprotein [Urbifossiella sp.]|jgi:phosphopantothenoylcysteine decarboxylase